MTEFEIWMEGYAATGERLGAQLIGKSIGETFDEAVKNYAKIPENCVTLNRFGEGRHAIWACELFDNEADARKSFG